MTVEANAFMLTGRQGGSLVRKEQAPMMFWFSVPLYSVFALAIAPVSVFALAIAPVVLRRRPVQSADVRQTERRARATPPVVMPRTFAQITPATVVAHRERWDKR
jgi:hypothetical protein